MQLIYLYIGDIGRNIFDQYISFSDEYYVEYNKKEKKLQINRRRIDKIYTNTKEFTEIFNETNYYIAKQKYEQYINKYKEIPEVLQQFMEKHVINFIDG